MLSRILRTATAAAAVLGLSIGFAQSSDKSIIIGHFGEPTPAQLVAASDEFPKETGFTIEWTKFQAGPDVIATMASGDVKLAQLGSTPFTIAATRGVDLQIFMIEHGISTGEALIARNGSGIEKVEDLKGKKVGVPLGSTAHYSLLGALENAGIPSGEVMILGMTPIRSPRPGHRTRSMPRSSGIPRTKALENGKMIISAGEVEGKLTYNAWVVDREFAEQNPEFMVAFVKAMDKANAAYTGKPDAWTSDSEFVRILAERSGANAKDIPEILSGYTFPLAEQTSDKWFGGAVKDNIGLTAKFLMDQKRIPATLDDYSKFVNDTILTEAAK